MHRLKNMIRNAIQFPFLHPSTPEQREHVLDLVTEFLMNQAGDKLLKHKNKQFYINRLLIKYTKHLRLIFKECGIDDDSDSDDDDDTDTDNDENEPEIISNRQ